MKKRTKLLSMALSVFMGLSMALTACTSGNSATVEPSDVSPSSELASVVDDKPDISKEVKLTMYLLGDRTPDFGKVFDQINTKMKEKINATLECKFLSWGEYEQKYPLVFASGEDFDIIYSADWAFYNAQSTKSGFYEITKEALTKYAPMSAETMYPEAWEQAKVGGKVYMLPMNYKELTGYVYLVRGDLMKKNNITDINGIDGFEKYLDAVAKNQKQFIPLDIGSDFDMLFMFDRLWGQATAGTLDGVGAWQLSGYIARDDTSATVKNYIENPKFLEVATKLKDFKDRGFWSKSAVVNTTTNKESFAAGKSAAALMNMNDAKSQYGQIVEAHPEWDIKSYDAMGNQPATLCSFLANGMSIFSKSKNPKRALMALDLLRNDEACHDLFCYGIEGVHYEKADNGRIKSLEASANYSYDGNCNWGIRNDKLWKPIAGGIPNYDEIFNGWLEKAESGKYATFSFDDSSVKNEVAAMNEIFKTDYKLLGLGFTSDPASDISKMQAKLKAAGADKVYAEMQKQAAEFIANQPK